MDNRTLHPDLSELLRSMKARRVRFVVVGGYALAVAGVPRATYDLDVFVEPSKVNARRLAAVFKEFGYAELARIAPTYFAKVKQIAAIGRKPLQVDFITTIDGLDFPEAWRGRTEVEIDGVAIPFLGFDALLKNKRASGRDKDLVDVQSLERLQHARSNTRAAKRRR